MITKSQVHVEFIDTQYHVHNFSDTISSLSSASDSACSPNERSFSGPGGFVRELASVTAPKSASGNWPMLPPIASRGPPVASRCLPLPRDGR